ncbi:hypothetical protein [Priestia megaterium]|uniref:hypothetical protein n=1 Tax=Priestia megaterium TaxID=1404 RepID=UPI001BE5579E|nr:hypothetical protein [Priestia megaterium]MBT2281905.1 hypothetical protein [Priestia megaterium]MDH3144438.1 hypothetical protein [Priestia megaterium]MED4240719.1 hypothetical protein [Priestia megaterium]MED4267830.1 hypothetical protein [Priestia megaterium]MED4278468.1 hypothetical protein [Priestia megaterium]
MIMTDKLEAILWSIALPGFAQLLNRKFVKGIVFLLLEFLVNVNSHFNMVIMHSFQGNIREAIEATNYQWLMFYPCLYMFTMWDAYKDAKGETPPYSYLPFVFGAYFVTIGLMYSPSLKLGQILFGPVWLPILFLIPGFLIGNFIRSMVMRLKVE